MKEPTHFESLFPDTTRAAELEKLLHHIKGGNACELIGLPGVGRSTTLRLLPYNKAVRTKHLGGNEKWYHFVLVDFTEVKDRPVADAIKLLFLSLVDSLRERRMQEYEAVHAVLQESLPHNDDLVLLQGLKRVLDILTLEKELTLVFLFDKFETYAPSLTAQFFVHLKALQNRAKYRLSIVFSTDRPLEEIVDETILPDAFALVGNRRVILTIKDQGTLEFLTAYIEKVAQKHIPDNIKKDVYTLTAGHGKLAKFAFEQLIAEYLPTDASHKKVQTGTPSDIKAFLEEDKTVRSMLYEIWEHLTTEEQEALKKVSQHVNASIPSYLTLSGLVENNAITIPLFTSFVAFRTQTAEETLTIDEKGTQIYKGTTLLSEYLTSYEFRLLKFFLQHPNDIVERNTVIEAVWSDSKSTAGVSEEALDQLIFRVRRKIESDPNEPTHLLTVKGRGFKFIP